MIKMIKVLILSGTVAITGMGSTFAAQPGYVKGSVTITSRSGAKLISNKCVGNFPNLGANQTSSVSFRGKNTNEIRCDYTYQTPSGSYCMVSHERYFLVGWTALKVYTYGNCRGTNLRDNEYYGDFSYDLTIF